MTDTAHMNEKRTPFDDCPPETAGQAFDQMERAKPIETTEQAQARGKRVSQMMKQVQEAPPIPASIRVGYKTYTVGDMDKVRHMECGRYGEMNAIKSTVAIHRLGDITEDGNTMLHELLHCCYWAMDISDKDDEESTVAKLANGLTQVWQDNPDLIAFLDAALGQRD